LLSLFLLAVQDIPAADSCAHGARGHTRLSSDDASGMRLK